MTASVACHGWYSQEEQLEQVIPHFPLPTPSPLPSTLSSLLYNSHLMSPYQNDTHSLLRSASVISGQCRYDVLYSRTDNRQQAEAWAPTELQATPQQVLVPPIGPHKTGTTL